MKSNEVIVEKERTNSKNSNDKGMKDMKENGRFKEEQLNGNFNPQPYTKTPIH